MNSLVYLQANRTVPPVSGVGRHINEIVPALAARPGVTVELLASREYLGPDGRLDPRYPLHRFPVRAYRYSRRTAEWGWKVSRWPGIDALCKGADIVYSPSDVVLPLRKVPWVPTIHDVMTFEPGLPWSRSWAGRAAKARWSVWLPKVFRRARAVFTVTEFSKGRMIELLGADPAKIRVVPNGIGPEFFAPDGVPPATTGDPYLITVGGLTVRKGGVELLAVARELAARRNPLRIVVVGGNEPDLAAQAKAVGNIDLVGRLPDDAMRENLRSAAALIFLSHYEGFGIPVLEAMAARVPVIAAQTSSLPEVVGDAGILVDLADPRRIADTAIQLTESPAERAAWIARGVERAKVFTWEAAGARLEEHLRECV